MISLIEKAEFAHNLTKDELVLLLKDNSVNAGLFAASDRVRAKYVGNAVELRGLIEFSNICRQNCNYCGIRRDNGCVERYRLESKTVIEYAKAAVDMGYKTIVLQSGEDSYFSQERMCYIISEITKLDVAITLSIGEKTEQEYLAYKQAGADRYLLRIETTDKELYKKMHPGMSHENRKKCLEHIRNAGYELGTGCLVGLPEQTLESLADDILFFKELNADMIGVGPFIPNENTPLKDANGGAFELSLKVMALIRLLLPDINIPATTAMEVLHPNGRIIALQSGANVVMPNVTEVEYKKLYALYPGKIAVNDAPADCRDAVIAKITAIGRTISETKGFRPRLA